MKHIMAVVGTVWWLWGFVFPFPLKSVCIFNSLCTTSNYHKNDLYITCYCFFQPIQGYHSANWEDQDSHFLVYTRKWDFQSDFLADIFCIAVISLKQQTQEETLYIIKNNLLRECHCVLYKENLLHNCVDMLSFRTQCTSCHENYFEKIDFCITPAVHSAPYVAFLRISARSKERLIECVIKTINNVKFPLAWAKLSLAFISTEAQHTSRACTNTASHTKSPSK